MYGVCVCMKSSVGVSCVRAKQVVQQLSKGPGKTQRIKLLETQLFNQFSTQQLVTQSVKQIT